ncbi:GntR family transcriptional regulator [Xanthobacter sp. KR7-65]|uniref:GntR family transcriptional regulator n=1 Tax=Xanthobacter sp. KR7-65 TaxID=3156612 RepID=UPI0032B6171A
MAERRSSVAGIAPRLHERAFDILAAQIASGALAPGQRLLESHVAERFGISRAPARQALARLERAGLLRRAEGHGFEVVSLAGPVPGLAVIEAVPPGDAPIQLAPESTWQRIYADVEQEVVSRTALGAFRVVENHLAAYYGVSRTVAREVLSRLNQRGIVRKDARLHWYAPALTPAYVAELFEMRAILEPAALRLAAPRLSPQSIAALRANLLDATARPEAVDAARLGALESELHVSLLGQCGNATLMEALATCQTLLVALTFLYSRTPQNHGREPFIGEHLDVAERLASGAVDAAADALRDHLRGSFGRAVERLDRVRRDFSPGPLPYLASL